MKLKIYVYYSITATPETTLQQQQSSSPVLGGCKIKRRLKFDYKDKVVGGKRKSDGAEENENMNDVESDTDKVEDKTIMSDKDDEDECDFEPGSNKWECLPLQPELETENKTNSILDSEPEEKNKMCQQWANNW